MFGEKMKKAISIALIFGMVLSGNGFTTLAGSVDDLVTKAEVQSENSGQKNYYQMMYQEQHYEKTTIVVNNSGAENLKNEPANNFENNSSNEENKKGNESGDENKTTEQDSAQNKITDGSGKENDPGDAFNSPDDGEEKENDADKEEPEDDEQTTTKKADTDEEETTTVEKTTETSDENNENQTTTKTNNIDESTSTVAPSEGESTTTVAPTDETTTIAPSESTTETSTETSESSTEATTTTEQTSSTDVTTTTTKEIVDEESTTSDATKQIVESEENENATTSDADKEEKNETDEATTSDAEKENVKEATLSEIDLITDLKSTESEIKFEKVVATVSTATKSETVASVSIVQEIKYILATRSQIATTSIWQVKKFLIDDDLTGSFIGKIPTEEEMNEKYLPKVVRVLVEDQLGNQRVVTIDAKWDRIRVNQQSGARVKKVPIATKAYVPQSLINRGLKVDTNLGKFAPDTIDVAKEDADRKYNEQVQKGINDFYAEVYGTSTLSEIIEETIEAETEETAEEETTKEETTKTEETTKEETTKEEETTTTEVAPTEATTNAKDKEDISEPTVAGFTLTEDDAEPEEGNATGDDEGTTVANASDATNNIVTKKSTNSNTEYDSAVTDPYVIDAALQGLADVLGEDSVVIIPEFSKPIQLTTFGDGNGNSKGGGLFGAATHNTHGSGNYVNYHGVMSYVADLTSYASAADKTYTSDYIVSAESDIVDYANGTEDNRLLALGQDFSIDNEIDFKGKNFYLCANGSILTFTFEEDTKNNTIKAGTIKNCGNIIVTDCTPYGSTRGSIAGLNSSGVPYDRKASVSYINQSGTTAYKKISLSCLETRKDAVVDVVSVTHVRVRDIWSNVHDKIQFTGYDDDAAAFINAKAKTVFMGGVEASRLVGAQGGLMKVEEAEFLNVRGCTFEDNKAFKGACFNVRFKTDTAAAVANGKGYGTNKGVYIRDNTFKNNAYAFFDRDDENPYTFGRYPFKKTYYYKVDGTGLLKEKITYAFNETGDGSGLGYTRANDSKPKASTYQYQKLGYEKTTYNYDKTVANGLVLVDNVGIGAFNDVNSISVEGNNVVDNMPYDLCGTFHISISNSLADSVPGAANKGDLSIDVINNTIQNNCQYKSSKNDGDVASGLTISMNPDGYVDHRTVTYEEAYKMGTNSEAIPYEKAVYENGEYGVGARLDFFDNYINDHYNSSPNPGAICIRNIKEVQINNTTDPGITPGHTAGTDRSGDLRDSSKVAKNNFTTGGGAAFEFMRNGKTRVYNMKFEENEAITKGGAVYINGERDIEFVNEGTKENPTVVFRDNIARTFGGAVYASDSIAIKFTKVDFHNNYLLSGKRWVTTMGLVDYYTNWFYGYQQGSIRKTLPKELMNDPDVTNKKFSKIIESGFDMPFATSDHYGEYYYVIDEDATYVCTRSDATGYVWKQLDDAWTYYEETRKSAKRGFVEPYLFGDYYGAPVRGVYVKRGSTETIEDMFAGKKALGPDSTEIDAQKIGPYDLTQGAIGGEVVNMGKGGALALVSGIDTEVIFDNCDIKDNISSFTGGAIYANTEKGMIRIYGEDENRAEVSGNLAGRSGGFMMIENTRASLSYVDVKKNHAEQGGAIFTFTDPDKNYKEEDSELYINKTDIVENGFLTDEDLTPYEKFEKAKENYDFSYFGDTSTGKEDIADKGEILDDQDYLCYYYSFDNNYIYVPKVDSEYGYLDLGAGWRNTQPVAITWRDNTYYGHCIVYDGYFYERHSSGDITGGRKRDGHTYRDINNEALHTTYKAVDKSNWTKLMKTSNPDAGDSGTPFYAGGAIYTYASQVKFDTGAYVAKNENTLYSIAGSTILTRQTTNHDLNEKEEEITFEQNKGQYVFGHFSTFKARFQFYGGKIVNNELDEKAVSDAKYDYIDSVDRKMGGKTVKIYTAYALSDFKKSEERSIVLGGNIMIKDNKEGDKVYNLGLEEGTDDRNYRFELSREKTLHKNAEIHLTPLAKSNMTYQLFGSSMPTWEEELLEREARTSAGLPWPNYGLWTDEWVASRSEGAVVQNVFKNDYADDPEDGRVIYTARNSANNSSRHVEDEEGWVAGDTPDFGQIYLENPDNLISMKFELYDLDKEGNHRYESQLETQYFSNGSRVQSPLSDSRETMKFSTDSSIRLIDLVGYQGSGNDKRFAVWDYEYQITKGDLPERILDPDKEINIPGNNDVYNVQTLFAINAMTNHRHKICGTPIGVPCNHPDGSDHEDEAYYYGEDGVDNLQTVSRKDYDQPDYVPGGHLSIEVSTLSQLMYARKHPEYMYVLTNDLILEKSWWNREISGIINDTKKPLENLKICLNGHSIYVNDNRQLATFFGENCYICNCQEKEVKIHYNIDPDTYHSYYPNTTGAGYVFNIVNSASSHTNLNIYGNDNGHIVIDELYFYNTNNSLMNLSNADKLSMANVDFKNIGANGTLGNPSLLSSSLIDIPCDAYISTVSFTDIYQTLLTTNPKPDDHRTGQGIIRLLDYNESDKTQTFAREQVFNNVTFNNVGIDKQYSSIIAASLRNPNSSLTFDKLLIADATIGGRAAIALSKSDSFFQGDVTIKNSTFSNVNANVLRTTTGYTGGAIYTAGNLGKLTIENNYFESCGVKDGDIQYVKALNGGAIYIGNTNTNTKGQSVDPIDIKNNKFIGNNGGDGGAIYLYNVPDTNLINNEFIENKANRGAAVYHENTYDALRQGSVVVSTNSFIRNGISATTTKGTYYIKLPKQDGKDPTTYTFTDFVAKENIGATSVLYANYIDQANVVLFNGETVITGNSGGPVLSINNDAGGTNAGYIRFTEKTLIKSNETGSSYAIYSGKDCSINVQFAGVATISENMNNGDKEANIYASSRINTGIVPGMTLDGPNSLLYFSTDSDRPIVEWAPDTIEGFETPGLYLEDHIKPDNEYPTSLFVIYKTNDPGSEFTVFIGKRTDAIVIQGYLTSTVSTTKKMLAKRGALGVYMDNFDTPSDALEQLRIDQPQYNDYEFGGWIIKNSEGEYEILQYGKTKINVTDEITLDAFWRTSVHDHKSCGCDKGTPCEHGTPDDEEWIGAFRESVLGIDNSANYLILEDMEITKTIKNPKKGYSICLNGHNITRNINGAMTNLVEITEDAGYETGFNLVNCKDKTATVKFTGSGKSSFPLVKVENSVYASTSIILKNFNINSIKYQSGQGSIVDASGVNLTWDNIVLDKSEVINRAIFNIKNSKTKIIGNQDLDKTSFDLPDGYYLGNQGLMIFDGGDVEFRNVQINNTPIAQGQGLIHLSNLKSFVVDNSWFESNKNNAANCALFNMTNVEYASISNSKIEGNETGRSGGVFYVNDLSTNSTINICRTELNYNKAGEDGAVLYYSNLTPGYKLTLNIEDSMISNNKSKGVDYGGGAFALYTSSGVAETDLNEINIKYTDYYYGPLGTPEIVFNESGANGGFIYAKDTVINIESEITGLAYTDEAIRFADNEAGTYGNGGAFYLDRSILNMKTVSGYINAENNIVGKDGRGAFIYSAGKDNTAGETNHKDGVYLKNVNVKRGDYLEDDESINGLVAIGPYSDLKLDGVIKIGTGSTTPKYKGLYEFGDIDGTPVEDLKISVTKASRSLADTFVYNADYKIYATTSLTMTKLVAYTLKIYSSKMRHTQMII